MKIDGKAIAGKIYVDLMSRVGELKKKNLPAGRQGITPKLAVILIGDDPSSVSYVKQKEKHAKNIGVDLLIDRLPATISQEQLQTLLQTYNTDSAIHGVIVQRPAPKQISKEFLDCAVIPEKDVDGFHPDSDFAAPVALAVERILKEVYSSSEKQSDESRSAVLSLPKGSRFGRLRRPHSNNNFYDWLLGQDIVVLGKGETAGQPIISHFNGRNAQLTVIDSQTDRPEEIIGGADIVISAVGKKDVITPSMVDKKAIVIGVGLHTEDGRLRGDFNNAEIAERVAYYSPTPGGVGPVNVAMLLSNVVRAAEEQTGI